MFISKRIFNVGDPVKVKETGVIGIISDKIFAKRGTKNKYGGNPELMYNYKVLINEIEILYSQDEIVKI